MSEQGLAIVPDKRGSVYGFNPTCFHISSSVSLQSRVRSSGSPHRDSLRADLRKGYIKLHPNAWDGRCVGDST